MRTKASDSVMLTVYRASAFFGVASIIGWYIWALLINDFHAALDWSLGGPQWAPRIGPP
jgi:TRAP-type C4-dicarboxylate transport system permease small subunit